MFSGVCVFSNTSSFCFQFLRNVTSGSFLEADQLREINVPLQLHACNAVTENYRLRVWHHANILYFHYHLSNCPQLKGEFQRNLNILVKNWEQSLKFWLSTTLADYRYFHMQCLCTKGVNFWKGFILYALTSKPNYIRIIASPFFNSLSLKYSLICCRSQIYHELC